MIAGKGTSPSLLPQKHAYLPATNCFLLHGSNNRTLFIFIWAGCDVLGVHVARVLSTTCCCLSGQCLICGQEMGAQMRCMLTRPVLVQLYMGAGGGGANEKHVAYGNAVICCVGVVAVAVVTDVRLQCVAKKRGIKRMFAQASCMLHLIMLYFLLSSDV